MKSMLNRFTKNKLMIYSMRYFAIKFQYINIYFKMNLSQRKHKNKKIKNDSDQDFKSE